jgi:diguanylate cyclase (GGDEF)-like protein/PAS domain S-box-containing protein
MAKAEVLIVEDDSIVVMELRDRLQGLGYAVCAAASCGEEAIAKAGEMRLDLVLMDIRLKGAMDGVEAAREIRARFGIPVVYLTAYADEATLQRTKTTEPYGYLMKPFDSRELHAVIETALHKHKLETDLRESEEKYRTVVEQSSDAIVLTDEQGAIIEWNQAAEQITGLRQAEVLGRPIWDIQFQVVPEEQRSPSRYEQIKMMVSDLLRTGQAPWLHQLEEVEMQRPDGTRQTIQTSGFVIPTAQGFRAGSVIRDITDRKRAEEALQESEARYRQLVEYAPTAIYEVDMTSGKFLSVNDVMCEYLGYSREELLTMDTFSLVADESGKQLVTERWAKMLAGEAVPETAEYRISRKDGGEIWVLVNARVRYEDGKPAVAEAVAHDITERKRAEEALRDSGERFRTFTESAPVATMIYQAYQCVYANPEAEQITGYSHQELQQMKFWDFLHPDYKHIAIEGGKAMQRGEHPLYKAEFKIITKNGDEKWLDGRLAVIEYEGKRATLISLIDITDRKRAEEEIRQRTAQLEALRQIGLELTAQLDLDALLRSIVSRAIELVGGDSGGLYLYRPEQDVLKWVMAVGPIMAPIGSVLRRGEGLSGKVLQTGEPIIVDDYQAWEGRAAIYKGYPFKAVVGVPVRWGEEFLGVLNVLADLPCAFSSPDIELLGLFATQAAIAIRNARLYEEAQREIAERMGAEEIIKQMAYHDDLTGLPNRRLLNDRLILEMAHAQRNRQKVAVMLLDLDHFKEVNDTLGHSVGDKLLQAVGERLTSLLRKGDTVARMGGDEFMLLLPGITRLENVARTARKILEAFRRPVEFDRHELCITTSIGIALYPDDGEDSDTLMKNADIAMYRAKGEGRDNYQCYTSNER